MSVPLKKLWLSNDDAMWEEGLQQYWSLPTVLSNHAMEIRATLVWKSRDQALQSTQSLREFLADTVYPWKDPMRASRWRDSLQERFESDPSRMAEALQIFREAEHADPETVLGRLAALQLGGMAVCVASAALTLLYPETFGTVDRFTLGVVMTLPEEPAARYLRKVVQEPRTYLNQGGAKAAHVGAQLIHLYRLKAKELTAVAKNRWNARAVEMVIFTAAHVGR